MYSGLVVGSVAMEKVASFLGSLLKTGRESGDEARDKVPRTAVV